MNFTTSMIKTIAEVFETLITVADNQPLGATIICTTVVSCMAIWH